MKNKINILLTIFILVVTNKIWAQENIISASHNNQSGQNSLPESCSQLFQESDKLLEEAAKQHGTQNQISQMREKLSSAQKAILQMDHEMQQRSCDKGLMALNNLKQKY